MKRSTLYKSAIVLFTVIGLLVTTTAMVAAKAEAQTIQGTIEQGEKGIMLIKTDEGQTLTLVGQNLKDMVGKKVKVTGTLTKSAKNKAIVVNSFEEIK